MLDWLKGSLPARAGLAVILIATLTFFSAFSAVLIAWVSEDDAAAINTAGSLRMAVYRLNWQLEANASPQAIGHLRDDMQRRLDSSALKHMVDGDRQSPVAQAFANIRDRWLGQLRPALERGDRVMFQQQSEIFVGQLEHFVLLLQKQSEKRQGWQQSIQGAALLMTVIILLVGMFELQSSVITPLQELVGATERFRAGDLNARIEHRSSDELGQMADSFNAMADAIEESHLTLASRVAEKTQQLAKSNAALELLYQSSRSIASSPASAGQLDALIDSFQQRLPGLRLSLCLKGDMREPVEHLIALHGSASRDICSRNECASCERHGGSDSLLYPISSQGNNLGELRAHYIDRHTPHPWERELIQALAHLIGTSLSLERQREQDDRLLLLDERTTIARELHDSLAQALSYMKLQVSRLQTLIRRGEQGERLLEVSDELRDGLNNAYRQLRELLTTFRLQIQDGGIEQALDDTAREFAERGGIRVLLESSPLAFSLSATEQIHLLQIAREALSNCARHAQAEQAWVQLRQSGEEVELLVEDDGVGITPGFDTRLHHGLNIMHERARSLGGKLSITRRTQRGTRVELRFCPGFLRQPSHEASL
ncbi:MULTISPECIES: HAMP domain-containing protein [unclassified Pseudomonas]|uniref:HAMP domain-containing protein n=1 Tax=unclassified Pseudomonas TaxID=196821 RepID=UPI0024486649|nr:MULTISPECIES: HAMP domain-containing protein [unclassified Pseudomonas]MDG9927211.1 HAMP domain-containing protein [Pseudomonas sp. GD04042]MDH0484401.1 HAMP domain-containing protein [Pseudomonas sp. GD04015]MDH0602633.1 HAMP domain-containing protein [Pseudomonas sp. GD03869]